MPSRLSWRSCTCGYRRQDHRGAEVAAPINTDNPDTDQCAEAVRQGPWGAVDDELAQLRDCGFEPEAILAPTAVFYDPDETVLPAQHPRWLAEPIPNSILAITHALGHRASDEDCTPDLRCMYGWLAGQDHLVPTG